MLEQSRDEELRRLATVVRDSNDAITLIDFKGGIHAWNRGAERMYGYSETEAFKMNVMDLVPPDLRDDTRAMLEKLQRGEEITSYETKHVTKDGRILDIWLTITVLKDDRGRPNMVATTERDITEIKITEERLRTSYEELKVSEEELKSNIEELNSAQEQLREKVEELKATEEPLRRLATVVRDSNDAILLLDFEGNIHAWNRGAERIYGYSEAEVLDKNVQILMAEADRTPFMGILKRLRKGEEIISYETRRRVKDGRTLDIWLTLTALKDESGKPYMVATTERDITDFKRNIELRLTMEKKLFETEQLQTAKEELEVANEELLSTNSELDVAIKNNEERKKLVDYFSLVLLRRLQETKDGLNARVRATAGELEGDVLPERRELLETLLEDDRKAATAMHDVTSLLKAFSAEMLVERVNLGMIVASIMDDLKRDDPHADVYVFIARTLYAYADRDLIRIALYYLLLDAWQHVRDDPYGRIFFMLSTEDSKFSFVIADTRKDYSIAEAKWLTEPWEYNIETPPSKFRIAVAKLIIEKNGGEIWADERKGAYSVHFKLPIIP